MSEENNDGLPAISTLDLASLSLPTPIGSPVTPEQMVLIGGLPRDWDAQQTHQEKVRVGNAVYLGMGPCKTALDARIRIMALLENALELMPQFENIGCTIDPSFFDRINEFRPKVD